MRCTQDTPEADFAQLADGETATAQQGAMANYGRSRLTPTKGCEQGDGVRLDPHYAYRGRTGLREFKWRFSYSPRQPELNTIVQITTAVCWEEASVTTATFAFYQI